MTGPIDLAVRIAELLDGLEISYVIGGSLASTLIGEPRATLDVDVAVNVSITDVAPMVETLTEEFYVDEDEVREAVRDRRSFNAIHMESMQKVDLFVLGDSLLDRRQLGGRRRVTVRESPHTELWVGSADDQVLRKLSWFLAGGEVSDRQWRDVIGLLVVAGDDIDRDDLRSTAQQLGLNDLLTQALDEADGR